MNKSIGKNIIAKVILNMFNLVVPILIGPYILRKLGPVMMAEVTFSQTIFSYFFIFASFGVYQYGLREISKVRDSKEKMTIVFTNLYIITAAMTILTTIVYFGFINSKYAGTIVYSASIILIFNLLSNVFYVEWINEALENYDFITYKTIVIRIMYVIGLFVLVKGTDDYKEYLWLLAISTLLNNLVSYIYIKKRISFNFSKIEIKKHIKPMILVVLLSNVTILYTQLDKFMIGEFYRMEDVAYYGVAQNITTIVSTLLLSVIHVTIPRLSNYSSNNKDEEYIELLDKISKLYFMILYPAMIGLCVLAKQVVLIYGGSEYLDVIPMLQIFSVYTITLGYETILANQVIYVKNREKAQFKIIMIGGIINLVLNCMLFSLNIFSAEMTIFTTMIANIVVILVEIVYIKKSIKLDFKIFSFDKLRYLIISLIFIPITLLVKSFTNNTFYIIGWSILINAGIYFGILFIIKDSSFNQIKNLVTKKIKMLSK